MSGQAEGEAPSFTENAVTQYFSVWFEGRRGIAVLPLIVMFPWRVAGTTDGA